MQGAPRRARADGQPRAAEQEQRLQVLGRGVGVACWLRATGDYVTRYGIPELAKEEVARAEADDGRNHGTQPRNNASQQQPDKDHGEQSDPNETEGDPGFHPVSVCTQAERSLQA